MRNQRFMNPCNRPRAEYAAKSNGESISPMDRSRVGLKDYIETVTKSGPVKKWADMTPEERKQVVASLKPKAVRP